MASSLTQPTPIVIPWASAGNKRTIPTVSQIGEVDGDGKASYPDGYPPLCGTPLASGGKPPSILDENGVLFEITTLLRFLMAGGAPKFNADMATAINGYPVGAILQDNSGSNNYINVIDGNSVDFNVTPSSIGDAWFLVSGGNQAGHIAFYARNTPPKGYLKANGAAVSRATYSALFSAIGTAFGVGDGLTTFKLPDLRGEFPRGWDDGRGVDNGRGFGTAQLDSFQGHHHSELYNTLGGAAAINKLNSTITNQGGASLEVLVGTFAGSPSQDSSGSGAPRTSSETRSRNISLLACIKY